MPGTEGCARCGSVLSAATIVMDVNPPRAGKFAKRWRRTMPTVVRAEARAIPLILGGGDHVARTLGRLAVPHWDVIWRSIVPGWGHRHAGLHERGNRFLAAYLTLGTCGVLFYGLTLGSIFLGLAIAVHLIAVLDLINRYMPPQVDISAALQPRMAFPVLMGLWILGIFLGLTYPLSIFAMLQPTIPLIFLALMIILVVYRTPRILAIVERLIAEAAGCPSWLLSFFVTGLFLLGVYGPMAWCITRVAAPVALAGPFDTLQAGQVVLVNQIDAAESRDGQVVLFNSSTNLTSEGLLGQRYLVTDQSVGRVVAGPGEELTWKGGVLFANGEPSRWQPVEPINPNVGWEFRVPQDSVVIHSMAAFAGTQFGNAIGQELLGIPRSQIVGRVYWRCQPLWKFGMVR
jgi:hypothetical protein